MSTQVTGDVPATTKMLIPPQSSADFDPGVAGFDVVSEFLAGFFQKGACVRDNAQAHYETAPLSLAARFGGY